MGLLIAFFAGIASTLALERAKDINEDAYRAAVAKTEAQAQTEARHASVTQALGVTVCGISMGTFIIHGDGQMDFYDSADPKVKAIVDALPESQKNQLAGGGKLCADAPRPTPFFGPRYPGERDNQST